MEDDLMFNLEDINVSQESLDFISESANSEVEDRLSDKQQQQIRPGNDDNVSVEINDNKPDATDKAEDNSDKEVNVDSENTKEGDAAEADEKSSQEGAPSPDESSSHDSTLYALAQYLKGEGVLFNEDEDLKDVKSLEDLKGLIAKSNEKARYANLNDSQKRYQEALETGIPKSEFENIEKEIQTFSNIKETDVDQNANLRYEIMAIDLMNQGIEQTKAMKLAKLSLQDETNVQDAKEALKNIVDTKIAKFEELKTTSSKSKEIQIDEFKKSIFDKEALLDQKLNEQTKNKLFDLITSKVDADEEGRPINELQKWQRDNPVESSIMLNYLFMMTDKGKNMKLINQNSTTTAAKDLERKLKSMSFDSDGSLIIPDQLMGSSKTGNNKDDNNKNKNNLTINI